MPAVKADEGGLIASYIGLLSLATAIIYVGAWSSLPNPPTPSPAKDSLFEDDEEESEDEDLVERLSSSDAYLFPVMGSVVLVGLYSIFKYFGKEWINWLLGVYFSITGVGSIWKSSISLCRFCVGEVQWKQYDKIRLLILKRTRELSSVSLRTPSILLLLPSMIPSLLYSTSWLNPKPAILSNILAISFAHNALTLIKLDSFGTGCIMLSGLFLYDIWWVFGTDVMVSVATGLDAPIKLLWPKSVTFSDTFGFTMLGLGDVVVPGVFITLALRYDLSQSGRSDKNFKQPYFRASLLAYAIGLATTMTVMHRFKAAQPALLYLSPACLLAFLVTATLRGELKHALDWRDQPAETPTDPTEYKVLEPVYNEQDPSVNDTANDAALSVSKSGDDFVNVEAEEVDDAGADVGNVKKRKGRKKKT